MAVGQPAEAETHLRLALSLNPENSHALLGLANLAIGRRDFQDAEGRLLEVVALDPNDVEANFNLGALYFQSLDRPAAAARYWQRFVELQPEDPESARIRQLLETIEAKPAPPAPPT